MAKRGISALMEGFNDGYETAGRVMKDMDIGKIANAKETTQDFYSAEDGAQLEAIAAAKDENGNPYYTVGTDANGKYTVTPNNAPAAEDGQASPARFGVTDAIAMPTKSRTEFLGKTYDKPLNDQEKDTARTQAIAGVYQKHGDPEKALALRMQAQQMEQQAKQGTLTDLQIKGAQRADAQGERDQKHQEGRMRLFQESGFAKNQAADAAAGEKYKTDMAAYQARLDAGDKTAVAPTAPVKSTYTVAQSLLDNLALAGHDVQHGKADASTLMKLAETRKNLDEEGYSRALKLAQGGATTAQLAEEFNKTGLVKLDPKNVVSDKMVDKGQGVKTRVLTFKGDDGSLHTIDTMAELDSLGKADQLFTRMFEAKKIDQADKNISIHQQGVNIQGGQLKLAQAANTRAQSTFDTEKPVHEANAEIAKLKIDLAKTEDPDEQAKLSDKIAALNSGRRGAGAQHDAADVAKAKVLVSQGVYPNQGEALDALVSKPDKLYQSYKDAAMKITMNPDTAIDNAKKMMADDGWVKTQGNTWKRANSGSPSASAGAPPDAAITMLKGNPAMAAQFDAKYGKGAAAKALGK